MLTWQPLTRSFATRLAAARGDAAMSAHLSQQLGGAEREPPAWLVHEIARRSRLPRPDDPAARAREGGAFLATSRRSSGAASARPVVLHFYSLACRRSRRRRRGNDRFPSRTEKQLVVSRDRIDLCSQAGTRRREIMLPTSRVARHTTLCTTSMTMCGRSSSEGCRGALRSMLMLTTTARQIRAGTIERTTAAISIARTAGRGTTAFTTLHSNPTAACATLAMRVVSAHTTTSRRASPSAATHTPAATAAHKATRFQGLAMSG